MLIPSSAEYSILLLSHRSDRTNRFTWTIRRSRATMKITNGSLVGPT